MIIYLTGKDGGGMLLAFPDEVTRLVCTTAARADGLWGQSGRVAIGLCLDLLACASGLDEVIRFEAMAVSLTIRGTLRAVVVSYEQAEVITLPVDRHGRSLQLSEEDDMTQLDNLHHLRVIQVTYAGRSACQARAS